MRNYWDPNFYSESRNSSIVMHYEMRMKDPVDGVILDWAVNYASQRYPYFKVRVDREGESLVINPNPLPIVVRYGIDKPVALCSRESNFHVCAVIYQDNTIFFELSHMMSDGQGRQPWVKSILYYYLSKRYGVQLDPTDINLVDTPITDDEIGNPFPADIPADQKPFFSDNHAWMHLDDYGYVREDLTPTLYKLTCGEDALMAICNADDSTPATLCTNLFARAIRRVHGDSTVYPIVGQMCVNHRPGLGCPKNYHFLISAFKMAYEEEFFNLDTSEEGTVARGQVLLNSDAQNSLAFAAAYRKYVEYLESLPTLEEKRHFARLVPPFATSTFLVSYVKKVDYGPAMPYIDSVYPHIGLPGMPPLLEINAMGGNFCLIFCQNFRTDVYAKAFVEELHDLGIESQLDGPLPHVMPTVDLD